MAARTATLKKSVATLAHGVVFTITTSELAAVVPGATIVNTNVATLNAKIDEVITALNGLV